MMRRLEAISAPANQLANQPSDQQIELLYQLLAARTHAISHIAQPAYAAHQDFVRNHPYRRWYLAWQGDEAVGSIYVQEDNSIGINLVTDCTAQAIKEFLQLLRVDIQPLPAIASVRSKDFFVNVAPHNTELRTALEALGHSIMQISYGITDD